MNNVCEGCKFELMSKPEPSEILQSASYSCQAVNTNHSSDQVLFKIYISGKYVDKVDHFAIFDIFASMRWASLRFFTLTE